MRWYVLWVCIWMMKCFGLGFVMLKVMDLNAFWFEFSLQCPKLLCYEYKLDSDYVLDLIEFPRLNWMYYIWNHMHNAEFCMWPLFEHDLLLLHFPYIFWTELVLSLHWLIVFDLKTEHVFDLDDCKLKLKIMLCIHVWILGLMFSLGMHWMRLYWTWTELVYLHSEYACQFVCESVYCHDYAFELVLAWMLYIELRLFGHVLMWSNTTIS